MICCVTCPACAPLALEATVLAAPLMDDELWPPVELVLTTVMPLEAELTRLLDPVKMPDDSLPLLLAGLPPE